MVRGIVSGLVWGGVVASAGLAVISQITPLPQPDAMAPAAPAVDAADSVAAVPPLSDAETAPVAPAPAVAPSGAPAVAGEDAGDTVTPEPDAAAAPAPPIAAPLASQAPDTVDPTAPDAPKAPAAPGAPPPPVAAPEAAPETPSGPARADALAAADAVPAPVDLPPPPPLDEALLAPVPDAPDASAPLAEAAGSQPAVPLPQIGTDADAPAAAPDSLPDTAMPPEAEGMAQDAPALPGTAADPLPAPDPSVAIDRLPRIGDDEPLPEVAVIADDAAVLRPIEAFARPFDNPDNKPLFSILLADDGSAGLDRQALASLPFPVTFVVDPLMAGAAEAAAIYRGGLKEVVFSASGLPPGATPGDVEQAFQAHALALPETVAVIDLPEGGFQDSRTVAGAVLPILAEQGRGLLTYDRGLNAADQIARRDGVPSATIFRQLDAAGESIPTIRRYLDRAAFRAAQEGEVVVIGSTRPDTVAALLEWTVEGRAASVALAPVSAVLNRP